MSELTTKEIHALLDAARTKAEEYVRDLVLNKKVVVSCPHSTNLKWELEHEPEEAIKRISSRLVMRFMGEVKPDEDLYLYDGDTCSACGEYIHYAINGNTMRPMELVGEFSNSKWEEDTRPCFEVKPYSVEFTVPSGNMIIVSWPEHGGKVIKSHENGRNFNINAFKGRVDESNFYAEKLNMAHLFVGNNSPGVYLGPTKDLLYVGRDGYYASEADSDKETDISLMPDGDYMGSICTDLWWSTAFDFETYKAMAIETFGVEDGTRIANEDCAKQYGVVSVMVKPGRYKCEHYHDSARRADDDYSPELFTKMEWIGDMKF